MSKLKLDVTIEDAFIIGQIEGQKFIIDNVIKTFGDRDSISMELLVNHLKNRLNLLNKIDHFAKVLNEGFYEQKQ